jgi:hypothetical protein
MIIKRNIYGVVLAFFLCTCLEEDTSERVNPILTTGAVTEITVDGAQFSGSIQFDRMEDITDHGFVWGQEKDLPAEKSFLVSLGKPSDPSFSMTVTSALTQKLLYFCRVFVKVKGKTVYGNRVEFKSLGSEAPTLTSFFPGEGVTGDTIILRGKNFAFNNQTNKVTFEARPAVVVASTDSLLKVIVPVLTSVSNKITIAVLDNVSQSQGLFKMKAPVIQGVLNTSFRTCDTVFIKGSNLLAFSGHPYVLLNNHTSARVVSHTNDRLGFVLDQLLASPITVQIHSPLFVMPVPAQLTQIHPKITSVSPAVYADGDTIIVTGTDWPHCKDLRLELTLNGNTYYSPTVAKKTANQIKFVIAESETCIPSPFNIKILTPTFSFSSTQKVEYKIPKITKIQPSHGKAGDDVIITGENFDNNSNSSFVNFLDFTVFSPTEIRGKVADVYSETASIEVTVSICNTTVTIPDGFTFDAPEIHSIYPPVVRDQLDMITITGANFSPSGNHVYYNDVLIDMGMTATPMGNEITFSAMQLIPDNTYGQHSAGKIKVVTSTNQAVVSATDLAIDFEGTWNKIEPFTGSQRTESVAFSINGKGYIGTGRLNSLSFSDWWEFDPTTETWTPKKDFPEGAGYTYTGIAANGKGYMGLGDFRKTWWQYDPGTDQWEQKADFPGEARTANFIFELHEKIYVGGGTAQSAGHLYDFWEYDPLTDEWTQKKSLNGPLSSPAKLAYGYEGTGLGYVYGSSGYSNLIFRYNPVADTWSVGSVGVSFNASYPWKAYVFNNHVLLHGNRGTSFPHYFYKVNPETESHYNYQYSGPIRNSTSGFVIGNKVYIGLGSNSAGTTFYSDFWSFRSL